MATELEMALQAGGKIKRPDLPLDFAPETDISGVASQMVTTPSVEPSFEAPVVPRETIPEVETDLQKALNSGGTIEKPETRGAAPFFHRAIAETAGIPIDIIAKGMSLIPGVDIKEPFGGTASIERGLESMGIKLPPKGARPKTVSEYMGFGVGEVATLFVPFAGAAKKLSTGTKLVNRVSKSIWEGILKHPYITAISETIAGAGAGAGRFVGEEKFPEKPFVRPLAEIAGGVVAGMIPTAITFLPVMIAGRLGKTMLKKVSLPFTEKGSKFRAGEFLKKQVAEPDVAAKQVAAETIGSLPPVVASKEKRLMAIYKQFSEADPAKDTEMIKRLSDSIKKLEGELRKFGYSAPEILRNVTAKRMANIDLRLQNKIIESMTISQKKVDALPVAQRQSKESTIVRNELEKTMSIEFKNTQEAWSKVPKDIEINYDLTRQTYKNIVDDLSKAELQDVPAILKMSFLVKKKVKFPVNVKEMQGLRSKLLEVQRIAKKDGQWNKARISGNIADAILDNLEKEGVDEVLKLAIASTRQFKEKFERGIVGKILGYSKSGAPAISPDLTLDVSIGRAGTIGAVEASKVKITPEAIKATEKYLSRSFTDFVTDKGIKNFNVSKANKWVENNREILDKFPELRNKLTDVSEAQNLADKTIKVLTARREKLKDPSISMTAKFLKSDPQKEIDMVFKSSDPVKMTDHLIRLSQKDQTGEAMKGLKGSFVDYLIEKSSIGAYNDIGEQTLSGKVMLGFISKNQSVLKKIFTPEDLKRMNRIGTELAQIEKAQDVSGGMVKVKLEDAASTFLHLSSRVGGARIGGMFARETPGGSLQTAAIFSKRFGDFVKNLVKDRADQLIHDAILIDDGGKLLQSLLLPIDKPTVPWKINNLKILNERMNLWLLGTGNRVLEDIEGEIGKSLVQEQEKTTAKLEDFPGVKNKLTKVRDNLR